MKTHDYDPEWDYEIAKPNRDMTQTVKTISKRIKKDLMPLKEFKTFTIAFIKNTDCLGTYVTGTHSEPVILLNLKELKEGCNEANVDLPTGIETTITHELAHAIQDARGLPADEEQAEDFAYNYNNILPLPLIK